MNPYDCPSTVAVSDCLKYWGKKSFADEFLAELMEHESSLPLDDMCEGRGYNSPTDSAWLSDLRITNRTRPNVEGNFRVQFTCATSEGCKDAKQEIPMDRRLEFKLNLETGEVEFEIPQEYSDYGH